VFENIAKVVKYAIAGLLAYISYTQFDTNTTISILSGISAFCMAFRGRLIGIIPSIIASVKMTKQATSSKKGAEDLLNFLEKSREYLEKDIVEKVQPLANNG
jgi:Zn-dependent peptidase ImmA (M78 family)